MAGELASAIALQGQPRNRPASVGPSEELIDNAFNRRRREEEAAKAKKAADDEKRLNEILKNTAFTKQFDNPYYNRKYQNDAARAMDDIIRTYSEGGENSFVVARNRLRELESIMSTYELADKNMSDARKAASEKPDDYAALFNQQQIGSKTHATMFDALNDPELAGREDEIAEAFESPSAMFMKEKVNGNDVGVAMFSLQNARTLDAFKKAETALKDNSRYTRLGKEFEIKNRNTQLKVVPTHLDDEYLGQVTTEIYSDPSVINNAVVKDFNAAKATAMEIDPSKNFTWKDYQALRGDLRAVAAKDADEFIANARKMTGQPYSVSDKLSADGGKNPSSGSLFESKKVAVFSGDDIIKAQEMQPWEDKSSTGQKYQYLAVAPIQLKQGVSMNIDIKSGTLYWDKNLNNGKGSLRAPDNYESTEKVIPHEMVFMSDGQKGRPYIRYLLAVSPASGSGEDQGPFAEQSSGDRFKTKAYESFYVPATEENLKRLAAATETSVDEWNKLKIELGKRSSSGRQAASSGGQSVNQAGQAQTGQQNPTSGVIGQTAKKVASTGAKPQKIDVTKLTGMDRVRAINQNRANGYE